MKKVERLLKKLLFPPSPWGIILGVIFTLISVALLAAGISESPVAYVSDALGLYGLWLLIFYVIVPFIKRASIWLRKNPMIDRYYTDTVFHARVILYSGLLLNICYASFKFAVGIWYDSVWFRAIGIYYIVLCGIKFIMVKYDMRARKNPEDKLLHEWSVYRTVGWLLFLLNLAPTGMIILVVWHGNSYTYPGFIIFAVAFYAFYRMVIAIVRLTKDKGNVTPIFAAAKKIDLIFAATAIFTLQTAMLSTFGTEDSSFSTNINLISGGAVSLVVIGVAIYMLIQARRNIKQIKQAEIGNR